MLCEHPAAWPVLLVRARAAQALGKPHRALSDLIRILIGRDDGYPSSAPVDAQTAQLAAGLFGVLSKQQRPALEGVAALEARAQQQPASDAPDATKNQMCIYKVCRAHRSLLAPCLPYVCRPHGTQPRRQADPTAQVRSGNLLFREGLQLDPTARRGAGYPCSAGGEERSGGNGAGTGPGNGSGPALSEMVGLEMGAAAMETAVEAARQRRCTLVRGARPLSDGVQKWDVHWWCEQLGGMPCHVLTAPAASNRFTYFWGGAGDSVHSHYESPSTNHSEGMSFGDFVRRSVTAVGTAVGTAIATPPL